MYCGKCGKRVLDDMLFCPFCGAAIVIPDQEEPAAEPVSLPKAEPENPRISEPVASEAPSEEPPRAPETEFVPLRFSFDESYEYGMKMDKILDNLKK